MKKNNRPIIGITMGDPVGVGPEIILQALGNPPVYDVCRPIVFGDMSILDSAKKCIGSSLDLNAVNDPESGRYENGCIDILNISNLDPEKTSWGMPSAETGRAMISYITEAVDMALDKRIAAMATCPINKVSMKMAGSRFHGHTELLAEHTRANEYAMMFAGDKLKIVLVTIHVSLKEACAILSKENILKTIEITGRTLSERFDKKKPCIAVAGLNPHAGENGMFGDEEKQIIEPAIAIAKSRGHHVVGPFPPDTVFYNALKGRYDAVVCMYHDQGLIPFKMIHFEDGVNITIGLPIIRTSVDHGTAYDIAGTGKADPGSLLAAIRLAVEQTI